jgi:DNA polymerase III delta subunit
MLGGMAEDLKPVYLLTGGDRPKITRALDRLRGRFDPAVVETLSAADTSGEDAVAACNALGLFAGGARLVLVEEIERWKAADAKVVATYLGSPAPETVLALVGDGVKRESPLAKACAKAGDLLVFDVQKRDLPRWVAEQFKRLEVEADAPACRALVDLVGESPDELAEEVLKIATWAGGEPVGEPEVRLLVAARAETPPWELTDAWGRRDVPAALAACEAMLEGDRAVGGLVWRLGDHVLLVRQCLRLAREGTRSAEAAKRLRRKEYPVRKAYDQAEAFADDELDRAIVRLAALDLATKGGSRLPDELELERALVEITRRERPRAEA